MKNVTLEEAINLVRDCLGFGEQNSQGSSYITERRNQTVFHVNNNDIPRLELMDVLSTLFNDVHIIDGQCRISDITLVYTEVYLEPVNYHQIDNLYETINERVNRWKTLRVKYPDYVRADGSTINICDMSDDELHELNKAYREKKIEYDKWRNVILAEILYRINKGVYYKNKENKQLQLF